MMTMTHLPERGSDWTELVTRARVQGESGVDGLLARLRPLMLSWARGLTGDSDRAEDLTQDALVRVVEGLSAFQGGSFQAWVYRIVRNLHTDGARSRDRRRRLVEGRELDLPRPQPVGVTEPAHAVSVFARDLTPRQRSAFQLVDLEGWSIEDAADALEVTPSTLRVHLHRARRTIRAAVLGDAS